jgi:hypothetical protein
MQVPVLSDPVLGGVAQQALVDRGQARQVLALNDIISQVPILALAGVARQAPVRRPARLERDHARKFPPLYDVLSQAHRLCCTRSWRLACS